jgi:glycogen synthase
LKVYGHSDVFIITSEFEGFPVSVLEAMAHGCVPVVTDIRSGVPELVQDGVNGYRVPIGDIRTFAERLAALYRDPARRQEMALNAHATVAAGGYRIEDMTQRYIALFDRAMQDVRDGTFRRPRGRILPPDSLRESWKDQLPAPVRRLGSWGKRGLRRLGFVRI